MSIDTRTKVLVWLCYLESVGCTNETKKLQDMYRLPWMHVQGKFSYSHVQNMLQPHHQSTKLRNMIVNIKTEVLIKFGTPEMCVELRAKKLRNVYQLLWMCVHAGTSWYTHTEVTNTISAVDTTQDYEYRHKNKGTGLAVVSRKCGVYKWDQESYKRCTCMQYWLICDRIWEKG